jgi:predicted P-loop ATPase/GTPase
MEHKIHAYLDTLEPIAVKQAAHDYLVELLHKLSISGAADELRLYVPTLKRMIADDVDIDAITYPIAAYIVFMCETNVRLLRILDCRPKGTAYYNRHGEKRYAPVTD